MNSARRFMYAAALCALAVMPAQARQQQQQQTVPPPKPFPGASTSTSKPPDPAAPAGVAQAPVTTPQGPAAPPKSGCDQPAINAPVYPGAEYVDSFDAGKGQRFCLFGTDAGYADIVEYYKRTVRSGNREIFRAPGVWQFDLGRFDENTMAYAPGILVKDYAWNGAPGYLAVRGSQERRYKTIIQIVPPSGPVR